MDRDPVRETTSPGPDPARARAGRPASCPEDSPKLNCWEFRRCGREPGGVKAGEMGVCPAAVDTSADGLNSGRNAGRICWAVSGHFSEGDSICCASARELVTCMACEFFQRVLREEGIHGIVLLKPSPPIADGPLVSPG